GPPNAALACRVDAVGGALDGDAEGVGLEVDARRAVVLDDAEEIGAGPLPERGGDPDAGAVAELADELANEGRSPFEARGAERVGAEGDENEVWTVTPDVTPDGLRRCPRADVGRRLELEGAADPIASELALEGPAESRGKRVAD